MCFISSILVRGNACYSVLYCYLLLLLVQMSIRIHSLLAGLSDVRVTHTMHSCLLSISRTSVFQKLPAPPFLRLLFLERDAPSPPFSVCSLCTLSLLRTRIRTAPLTNKWSYAAGHLPSLSLSLSLSISCLFFLLPKLLTVSR